MFSSFLTFLIFLVHTETLSNLLNNVLDTKVSFD